MASAFLSLTYKVFIILVKVIIILKSGCSAGKAYINT